MSMQPPAVDVVKRVQAPAEWPARLRKARALTDGLFQLVRSEALYDRPIPHRHRIIFYLGHLEAFDWNLLGRDCLGLESAHRELDQLFAFGIDPANDALPSDQPRDWPALDTVRRYCLDVRRQLDSRAGELPDRGWMAVAMEHRLMHAETLTYLLHQLPLDRKIIPAGAPDPPAPQPAPRMVDIPVGQATLGLAGNGAEVFGCDNFGWDNEFEAHRVEVPEFRIDAYKVTNGQFLGFVDAGGYEERSLWSVADWAWRASEEIHHPWFWRRRGGAWHYQTMFAEAPLPLEWPAYVSHAEASAYVRWAGRALPSEAQFHRAAYGSRGGAERTYPWGNETPAARHGNFDFQRWDPSPVAAHPDGASAFGVEQLVGNGWEWTASPFAPFPGFRPFPFYPGYSADFFDGRHFVMKGGSACTARRLLRPSFRNWFQPHYPYPYAGFRCVENWKPAS